MRVRRAFVLAVALFGLVVPVSFAAATDPFITDWDLSKPGSGPNQISFTAFSSGVVTYSWTTIPVSSKNGSSTFNGGVSGSTITISGLPTSSIIRLSIDTANFQSIQFSNELGQVVNTKKLTDQENISLSGLKPGVYSFKINQGNNVQYLRVVKQ